MFNIITILGAILILCLIVVAHEFGHYLAGRLCGIGVEEFSVGFGPKLFGWRRKETDYSLRLIPMGGYCKFVGEDGEGDSDRPDAMNRQKVWKRFVTILSGPLMNFVLAYLAVFLYLTCVGSLTNVPVAASVEPNTPAYEAGMLKGDVIEAVNGTELPYTQEGAERMRALIQSGDPEQPIDFAIVRGGENLTLSIVPALTESGNYQIGIIIGTSTHKFNAWEAIPLSGRMIVNITQMMLDSLKNLFFKGEGLEETMGPVGIVSFMSEEIRNGFDTVLNIIVMISLNLGILNLLPLPALDGGRLVFLIVEGIRRKPVKPEYEGWVHAAGFLLLIAFVLVITYKDIVRLVTGG